LKAKHSCGTVRRITKSSGNRDGVRVVGWKKQGRVEDLGVGGTAKKAELLKPGNRRAAKGRGIKTEERTVCEKNRGKTGQSSRTINEQGDWQLSQKHQKKE